MAARGSAMRAHSGCGGTGRRRRPSSGGGAAAVAAAASSVASCMPVVQRCNIKVLPVAVLTAPHGDRQQSRLGGALALLVLLRPVSQHFRSATVCRRGVPRRHRAYRGLASAEGLQAAR
jgi:hypothetical protein